MSKTKSIERIIHGTLFPARWNEKGEVKGLVIDTVDQDEYLIAQTGKGKQLMKCIHEEVTLTGTISEDERGVYFVHVKNYRLHDKRTEDEKQET